MIFTHLIIIHNSPSYIHRILSQPIQKVIAGQKLADRTGRAMALPAEINTGAAISQISLARIHPQFKNRFRSELRSPGIDPFRSEERRVGKEERWTKARIE